MPPTLKAILESKQSEINQSRQLHFYAKNREIPVINPGIWQVNRGLVQLSTFSDNGDEILLGWAGNSSFFGSWLTSLQVYQAKALSDVYLTWFSVVEIENSLRLSQEIMPQLVRRMRQTEILLTITGQRRIEDRLQRLLLLLTQEIGQSVSEGTRLTVRLTHQDFASAIGTTRVTITRLLTKLQQEGLIILDAKRHIILKNDSFKHISDW